MIQLFLLSSHQRKCLITLLGLATRAPARPVHSLYKITLARPSWRLYGYDLPRLAVPSADLESTPWNAVAQLPPWRSGLALARKAAAPLPQSKPGFARKCTNSTAAAAVPSSRAAHDQTRGYGKPRQAVTLEPGPEQGRSCWQSSCPQSTKACGSGDSALWRTRPALTAANGTVRRRVERHPNNQPG